MSMITELVQELREKAFFRTADNVYNLLDKAADTIEELSAKLQSANMERSSQYYNGGWIPCEDRLPEITVNDMFSEDVLTVLKWHDEDITYNVGWYNKTGSWNEDNKNCKVIAWMPLPEPYKPQKD